MLAIAHQVGHLEEPEGGDHRGHDGGGKREVQRAQLHLLHHLGVVAELARAVELDGHLAAQLLLDALGELLGGEVEDRAGRTDVSELQFERLGGSSGPAEREGGEDRFHEAA